MENIQDLVKNNKELFWDIWNLSKIDDIIIEERFLKYWNWENIKTIDQIFWREKVKNNYIIIRDKKRSNLSKKTINFFNLYYNV